MAWSAPHSSNNALEFRRDLRDSHIAISILPWIERGGHGDAGLLTSRTRRRTRLTEMAGDVLARRTQWQEWSARTLDQAAEGYCQVEWHPGELYRRVGFIVTNMSRPAERVVAFYNKRGRCEQREAKARSSRRDCRAERSPPMRYGSSFTRSPTISVQMPVKIARSPIL
jgi:hypothetical protein